MSVDGRGADHPGPAVADLLEHPDPTTAAQAAAVENLLRCWVRENDITLPVSRNVLRVPLPASGTALLVPVHYWSPTGWHRFGLPALEGGPNGAPPVDAVTLAALLTRESAAPTPPDPAPGEAGVTTPRVLDAEAAGTGARGTGPAGPGCPDAPAADRSTAVTATVHTAPGTATGSAAPNATGSGTRDHAAAPAAPDAAAPGDTATDRSAADATGSGSDGPGAVAGPSPAAATGDGQDLVARVADSLRRTAVFIADRRRRPADASDRFLAAEQALILGHPLHPTPKSREGLSEAEAHRYSPELRGAFAPHWLAVAPDVLAQDSAWTVRGRAVPAADITSRLAGPGLALPDGHAALPVHPWQLRELRHRPTTAALLDAGLLRDLGPHGDPWFPTSSVRTLYRPGSPSMLKLSLGLRITNSRRENLRKELHRGVEVHRLLRAGVAVRWHAVHPEFDIVRDPAWLAVNDPSGAPVPGLDAILRHNPFGPEHDASCVAGFVSPRPAPGGTGGTGEGERRGVTSRLADTVTRLARRTGRPRTAVAAEWFLRYLEHVVRPVLWLDGEIGIALEAHQQNTLLLLDPDGWPAGGRYRDNQGYYFRESRRVELDRTLPGIGTHSDTFVSDEVTDERFAYYLAINNVLGLIGAFGSQRLADEELLLAAFRRFLTNAASGPDRLRSTLPQLLLDTSTLRCKANLLTRLHGLDELVGPVDTQSVYVTIANPLRT
ncbi:iron transporter [Streptomyces sp. GXMU-J5]|uniref:Iron transporter n=2 Tax=Streptomyces beihaiensis TaxID=2984495 RepID=A0ABT3TU23_9ACTN|nr:IucA/IucC family protein [Streptomyces beihaiensis]MCX3060532.1 iron transporter [Streptomyces beihaiensis]